MLINSFHSQHLISESAVEMTRIMQMDMIFSVQKIDALLRKSPKEKLEQLKETASDYEGCSFSVSNLVPSKVNIDTAGISIKTEIEKLSRIERRVIDGIDYYLIPVNSSSIDDILLANKHSK